MMDFLNITEILDFLGANLGIPDKSMISEMIPRFLGWLSFLDISEMMDDFPNIIEILDFLVATLGIPKKSMITKGFPHAKPSEHRNFSPIFFSPKPKQTVSGKSSREKCFWGGRFP